MTCSFEVFLTNTCAPPAVQPYYREANSDGEQQEL